jgi:hypothetical protein
MDLVPEARAGALPVAFGSAGAAWAWAPARSAVRRAGGREKAAQMQNLAPA